MIASYNKYNLIIIYIFNLMPSKNAWIAIITTVVFLVIAIGLAYFCPEAHRSNCNIASGVFLILGLIMIGISVYLSKQSD